MPFFTLMVLYRDNVPLKGTCNIRVYDWDRFSKDDFLGMYMKFTTHATEKVEVE